LTGNGIDQLVKHLALQKGQVTKKNPLDSSQAQVDSVIALYSQGQIQEALNSSEALSRDYPNSSQLYNISGVCHKKLGHLDKAIKCYQKALAINSNFVEAYNNLGVTLNDLGLYNAAVKYYKKALSIKSDYVEAHSNLGNTFQELGKMDAAVKCYEQALLYKPDYVQAYYNLGNIFTECGQLDAAVKSYEKALSIKPDYVEAHGNLGNTLKELGQFDKAVKCYEKVLSMQPNYIEAYNNLGIMLKECGQLDAAVRNYEKALAIRPDYGKVWNNLYFTAMPLIFSEDLKGTWLVSFKNSLSKDVLASPDVVILDYRLNAFKPHTVDDFFDHAMSALPAIVDEEITNPETRPHLEASTSIPENMIALLHFGRSGTGLLHSLIDSHAEILTLPSIYFSEYFTGVVWNKLIAQGWGHLPERFVEQFAVLFDARSSMPVMTVNDPVSSMGKKEGMANVGENRDEVLIVDKEDFCAELKRLMTSYVKIDPKIFFDLVHVAYEKALNNTTQKNTIFYHIHNPSDYAKLNFLRYNPESRLVMMVREPIQSCESWLKKRFNSKDKYKVHNRIITLLFDIDQIAFRRQDSIGVRLEDLKTSPKETMAALCDWMGIEEESSLYEMTAQGKKWWGDPTSPDYAKGSMSDPFSDSAITRKVGSIFSEHDQFILRTLFYPFSVRFGYVEENFE